MQPSNIIEQRESIAHYETTEDRKGEGVAREEDERKDAEQTACAMFLC